MGQDFVDVWSGHLALGQEELQRLFGVLNDGERRKAQAFKLSVMRDRFIAARGLLREVLGGYLLTDPADLQFENGEFGKPGLSCGSLYFNISHTGNSLLVAVANFSDIGIDIETIKSRIGLEGLARRCFSDREFECWRRLPPGERLQAFYRLWTKKEAFVKAVGRGIALGLDQCEVELDVGGALAEIPVEYGPATAWKAIELEMGADACAALVTVNRDFVLRVLMIGEAVDMSIRNR